MIIEVLRIAQICPPMNFWYVFFPWETVESFFPRDSNDFGVPQLTKGQN